MKYHFLITMAALLLVACQPDAPSDPVTETQGQDPVMTVAADTPAESEDPAKEPEPAGQSRDGLAALYAKAINHPDRPQTDSDRDSQRQPAETLALMAVEPGMEIFHIADLSSLWLSVEVFEDQVAWIAQDTPAEVTFTYFPGETFRGTVQFIEPEFSEETRTLRVKLAVPNPGGRLRPGMFATVVFEPVAARETLAVPSMAVLRTGQRNVVVVDLGEGRFEPREVTLGHEGEGYVAVLDGLAEGARVVTSAQFLLDSEASLQEAVRKMIAQRSEQADH